MQLRFELGDSDAPRGHAILYARLGSGGAARIAATYCVVLPIQFSIGKFLPPILSGQIPMEGLAEAAMTSVVPIPPMLEDIPSFDHLRQLAERRGDDLCDVGIVFITDDRQRMAYAAEACQSYGQLYEEYTQRWPAIESAPPSGPLGELDVGDVMAEVLPERDRLGELARLIGQARYAMDGSDRRLLDEASRTMHRIARSLPEKYRADQLVAAALNADATGTQLAGLYLQRAHKLLDEDYAAIPPIEEQIRALRAQESGGDAPAQT